MLSASIAQNESGIANLTKGRVRTERALGRMAARNSASRQTASAGVGMDVAKTGRTHRQFAYISGVTASADRQMSMTNLGKLRELCRAHDRNSALISGILNRALDNIFGDSFSFVPNTKDADLNSAAKAYIERRMKADACDAAGVSDFLTMCRTSIRGVWNDGDSMLVFRPDGSMIPFEADQIVNPSGRPAGPDSTIVMGVEMNRLGRPLKYHVSQRPESGKRTTTKTVSPSNVLFPAYRTRHGQTRGWSYLGACMSIFERLDGFIDWETFAAELNARATMKITRQLSEETPDGTETNKDTDTNSTFSKVEKMEGGEVFDLLDGEDIAFVESARPGPEFSNYITTVARIVGAAVGFPLELLMLDFSKTSWSSGRLGMEEARRTFRYWQRFAGVTITEPWYDRQIRRGIATGELAADERLFNHTTHWATWPYIQPLQAAQANQIQIANRTKTRSEVIREQNKTPEEVFDESEAEEKDLARRGIPAHIIPQAEPIDTGGNSGGNTDNPEQ